ncbi:uncharacterized protein LOC123552132 isoform X2 [Mercenaria mercenaria]|uniref:uncharacterized protein LOC123552132 isoform X2 n=1 Tax=Mercenaria mercenaria TaxID=6596 RepID=UPI00234E7D55|nr:uncharacterized protein LOC123552132 isoform X2 [Mercenaria mercenaria]
MFSPTHSFYAQNIENLLYQTSNMDRTDSRALYEMKLTSGMAFIYGPEGRKAHAQAIEYDKDKSYRMVVNIVGKVGQGKTSLRRLLVGEEFNEREESTVGIEHELVETLGTSPTTSSFWSKIDLQKANVEECDLIVGKHVRQRLKRNEKGEKYKAEIKSFLKATLLTYVMLFLYFNLAETVTFSDIPWFPFMLIVSLLFSGMVLFDTMRDGFGMAVGVMFLVLYCESLIRSKSYEVYAEMKENTCLIWSIIYTFFAYAAIHAGIGFCMGLSMAMGFCFALSAMKPPWNDHQLEYNVFLEPHMHLFSMAVLAGIWTIRHPKLVGLIFVSLAIIAHFIPITYVYCIISGIGVGFSHAFSIKVGFDTYVKLFNPFLKTLASDRRSRRLICYVLGIIPGFYITYILGWQKPERPLLYAICGTFVVVFVEICHCLLEGKTDAAPKPAIKDATKVLNATRAARLKLVIRDFAGHPLYHSIHHIYMMGHCIYIICFNIAEAKRNFRVAFAEILYWLQSIFVHDRYPSVRVFIVGTHRDDNSLSKEDTDSISDSIMTKLPRQFHNMIVWNKHTDKPVFLVENSSRSEKDRDHLFLREQLSQLADSDMKPTYPIKYLYFYRVINECRQHGKLIETLENILSLCKEQECILSKAGELEDMLTYFHECGETIYNSYDNNQNQLVVLDPKALVDIMIGLVRAPPRAERKAEFLLAWQTVADLGIASKKLLHHIIKNCRLVSEGVSIHAVIQLLEYLDLVCKLNLGIDGRDAMGEKCYLITPLLKDTLPYPQNYWDDIATDTKVYIDFGPVVPTFVFARLVCQCTSESHVEIGTDGRYHLNVSTSKALFTYCNSHSFKIELLDITENASPAQHLLKIVVRGLDQRAGLLLTQNICQKVCNIVERDFRKCRFKIGVMCPFEGPHDFCQYEERHIFSLYENIKGEGNMHTRQQHVHLPEDKEFWCRGNAFKFLLGQVVIPRFQRTTSRVDRRRSALWDVNILDLPPRLFSDVCDDLNLFNALGRDWRLLADKLGRSIRDIELLRFRNPRDPCDALLQDWAATTEVATVATLVEKLREMERFDVVKRIEDYVTGS